MFKPNSYYPKIKDKIILSKVKAAFIVFINIVKLKNKEILKLGFNETLLLGNRRENEGEQECETFLSKITNVLHSVCDAI